MGKIEIIIPVEMRWTQNGHNCVFAPEDAERKFDMFYDNEGKPLTTNDKLEVSFEVRKRQLSS